MSIVRFLSSSLSLLPICQVVWKQTCYKCSFDVPLKSLFLLIRGTQKKQEAQMCQNGHCMFLIFFQTTWPIGTKLVRTVHWMSSCLLITSTQKKQEVWKFWNGNCLFLIFSEATGSFLTNLGSNVHWVILLEALFVDLKYTKEGRSPKLSKWVLHVLIVFLETIVPIATKLGKSVHWTVL